ncbi:hypothetical protein JTB14_033350 [Gonioctena quinquepunctata]|nr:hypothetical protein JTB14_033350 [Gonioctena quinquepunctata]
MGKKETVVTGQKVYQRKEKFSKLENRQKINSEENGLEDDTKKTGKTAEEGQNDDETSELAHVLAPEEFENQSKFHKAEVQGNIEEKIIHSSVEENTSDPELQVELPLVEGLEINSEVQKTNGTENGSEIITKDELKNKINIGSSDSEDNDDGTRGIEDCDCIHYMVEGNKAIFTKTSTQFATVICVVKTVLSDGGVEELTSLQMGSHYELPSISLSNHSRFPRSTQKSNLSMVPSLRFTDAEKREDFEYQVNP